MAVRPQGVLPGGRPGRVDHAGLGDQAVRALRHSPRGHVGLAAGDLASVPPRCTVPASRQAGACQGTGPLSAKSTLQTPGPYRNRRSAARCRPVSRSPASAISWRGVTSSRTARAGGSSSSDRTHRPVSTSPPSAASSASSASVSRALPPSTTGQPTACAAIMSSSPNALVTGALSGSMEWAATPANRPCASGGAEPAGHHGGGREPVQAEPGHGQRVPGHGPDRGQDLRQGQPGVADERAEEPPVGARVAAQAARGLLDRARHRRSPAAVKRVGERDLGGAAA